MIGSRGTAITPPLLRPSSFTAEVAFQICSAEVSSIVPSGSARSCRLRVGAG
jgi:hypothetical protein